MAELGELITDPKTFVKEQHDKKICPWHVEGTGGPAMEEADENDDKPKGRVKAGRKKKAMPENDGGKLGDALIKEKYEPKEVEVAIYFIKDGFQGYRKKGKGKKMVLYAESSKKVPYDLDFAAHHLIPGNAALKNSAIAPFLGDQDTVANFSKSSKIKKNGKSAGYDVNCFQNGQWLPSPYALSMNDGNSPASWPNEPGMKAALRDEGEDVFEVQESFKLAYAKEAAKMSGGQQFHMVHEDYSREVKKHLLAIKAKMMACPEVDENQDKFDNSPGGLAQTLHSLSERMRGLLTGIVWHSPFFVDDINKSIARKGKGKKYVVAAKDKVI